MNRRPQRRWSAPLGGLVAVGLLLLLGLTLAGGAGAGPGRRPSAAGRDPAAGSPHADAIACPDSRPAGPRAELAFWALADDRDSPPGLRPRMASELAARIRCVGASQALLLHGGDSYNYRWYRDSGAEVRSILADWAPLRSIPGLQLLLAPGNHERQAGARELALQLGVAPAGGVLYQARSAGPLRFVALDTEDRQLIEEGRGAQADWLARELAAARRDRQLPIVLMHRPPAALSCGHHWQDQELARWGELLPRLLGPGPPGLVLASHDHLYARIPLPGGWTGALIGNAGAPLSTLRPCPWAETIIAPTTVEKAQIAAGSLNPDRFYGYLECVLQERAVQCRGLSLGRTVYDRFSLPLPEPKTRTSIR